MQREILSYGPCIHLASIMQFFSLMFPSEFIRRECKGYHLLLFSTHTKLMSVILRYGPCDAAMSWLLWYHLGPLRYLFHTSFVASFNKYISWILSVKKILWRWYFCCGIKKWEVLLWKRICVPWGPSLTLCTNRSRKVTSTSQSGFRPLQCCEEVYSLKYYFKLGA